MESTYPERPLLWPDIVSSIRDILHAGAPLYIVGGAVRDAYLHRPLHDLDLATPNDGRKIARALANQLGGAYYPLDDERRIGRVIVTAAHENFIIDVAKFRGNDLLADLHDRDFTANAMAVHLQGDLQAVFDPLGGLADLKHKRLKLCHPAAIANDPIRALRAVRMCVQFQLQMGHDIKATITENAIGLKKTSPERVRDEFLALLGSPRPALAVTLSDHLALLPYVIPELEQTKGVGQPPPHLFDVWQHTIKTVWWLDRILKLLSGSLRGDSHPQLGYIRHALHGLIDELRTHNATVWPNQRSHHALMILAALLHDIGKPATQTTTTTGIHFHTHETVGAELAEQIGRRLRLSNEEVQRLANIVRHHMRPLWLSHESTVTKRAIYRYWRDTGPAGVDIWLLAMADYLATVGHTWQQSAWVSFLNLAQDMLHRYYQNFHPDVAPQPLLSGRELIARLNLSPGPLVGKLLDEIAEAQASGEIATQQEAIAWARRFLEQLSSESS